MKPFGKLIFIVSFFLSLASVQAQSWLANGSYSLAVGTATNGQYQFVLNGGEARANYLIESSSNLVEWMPVITNRNFGSNWFVTLTATNTVACFRAVRDPIPLFGYALAVRDFINMNGDGIAGSSYNSHDPDQSLNGHYDGYAGTNGDIGSQQGLINLGNHGLNGDVYLGQAASIVFSAALTGPIYGNANLVFPDVSLPTDSNGFAITWSPAPGNSSSHSFTNSGYYYIDDNGGITVEPGAKVTLYVRMTSYVPAAITIKGATTNAASVVMYQESGSLSLNGGSSGGAINNRPENFMYFAMPGVTSITFIGDGTFVGVVYAPQADILFYSVGAGFDFVGSVIVKSAQVNGRVNFHCDTFLRTIFLR